MKFGQNLHKHQVPLWAGSYLDYNRLKRLVKLARAESAKLAEAVDCTAFLENFYREIDTVQAFYHKIYTALWDEVSKFYMSLDFLEQKSWDGADRYELHYFLGIFIQCRSTLKKLQWYGTVNTHGFRRLLQKLDYLRSNCTNATMLGDIESKLSTVQFSSQTGSLYDLQCIHRTITAITRTLSGDLSVSNRSLILDHFVLHWYSSLNHSNVAYEAIRKDDMAALDQFIQDNVDMATTEKWRNQMLIHIFIQLSIISGSKSCMKKLLLLMESIQKDDFTAKNYLPLVIIRILVKMGHLKMLAGSLDRKPTCVQEPSTSTQIGDDSIFLLSHVLAGLGAKAALLTQDPFFKRLPLQYAAQYGLSEACGLLLSHMQGVKIDDGLPSSESVVLQDCLGNSPLRLAIICGYDEVSRLLLGFHSQEQSPRNESWNTLSGPLLADAIKSNPGILKYLLAAQANVNHQGADGETALYIAARSGDEESVKILLSHKASANIVENAHGWTPLFVASVEGHIPIVELLMQASAIQEDRDLLGWTALDHAAFRGHIALAENLRRFLQAESRTTSGDLVRGVAASSRPTQPIRMPINESPILVNLGSFNSYKNLMAVNLGPYLSTDKPTLESEVGFSIEVSLIGRQGSSHTVDLPILEDMVNKPWAFYTKDPGNAKLMFKVHHKEITANKVAEFVHIGSGIALLDSLKEGLGSTRESLIRDYNIPILAKDTLKDIGTITFSFLIVKPLSQSKSSKLARNILWKDGVLTKVVGHRGLGQNIAAHKHLSIGENTIRSFLTAIDLGADLVELDVQLTKDHVPVVYHDFLISETGTDAWMHNLSLEQLTYISSAQSGPARRSPEESVGRRWRSYSLDASNDYRIADLMERMKHTFEFKQKGFKGNTRGNYIHEPFITLNDLLSETPDSIALNIEIKYPMLFEAADDWKSDIFAIEINLFVDTILSSILSHPSCHSRPIMFSSFSPEICILVSLKQTSFPIFFLNDSGNWPTGDARASSLQEAIHFAKRWELDGVVMASEPFIYAPKLIGVAKERGLVTASYGALNNEPECAKIQAAAGLDIIIVDAVRLISETLNGTR